MSRIHLYLSADQRDACLRALYMARRWVQGDVGVFAVLADQGYLRDKDGKPLSLSQWSTIVGPALTDYAALAAGTTPGQVLDVHDPATHPLGALALQWQAQWSLVKPSKKHTTLAALPTSMQLHKTNDDMFNVYDGQGTLVHEGMNAQRVLGLCPVTNSSLKVSIERNDAHKLIQILDIYCRVLMNQWEYLKELTEDRWEGRRNNWHEQIDKVVKTFKEPWTGYSMNGASGIHSPTIHGDALAVWSVQKAVRHWEIVQRLGYTHRGVSSDPPSSSEKWPLVDSDASVGLRALAVGSAIVHEAGKFWVVAPYVAGGSSLQSLACSYSPVSLLDALACTQSSAAPGSTF